jgi:hypothetical protein
VHGPLGKKLSDTLAQGPIRGEPVSGILKYSVVCFMDENLEYGHTRGQVAPH